MDSWDRLEKLVDKWLEHCHSTNDPKHIPFSENGPAHYDANLARTIIVCTVPDCKWEARIEKDNDI